MKDELLLATICLNSRSDKQANLAKAERFVREAAELGADWIILPEMLTFFGTYDQLYANADREGEGALKLFAQLARELQVCLFAGTVAEKPENDVQDKGIKKVYNTAFVFDRSGQTVAKYRKIHLFLLNDPGTPYCESDGYLGGEMPVTFDLEGFRVGLAICFDIRFPELFYRMGTEKQVDILAVPSAFTLRTGMAHWELMLRARAAEMQAHVFAANQTGDHGNGKSSYGHSMIINAWGEKLADTGKDEGIAFAKVSRTRLNQVRGALPLRNCRKIMVK